MKCLILLSLLLFANPSFARVFLRVRANDPPKQDKGKGRPRTPSDPPKGATPTPNDDTEVPLPGRSGWYNYPQTGLTTGFYGDDYKPEHLRHLDRNQQQWPSNLSPMRLAKDVFGREKNPQRTNALRNIPAAPPNPISGRKRVIDEKMPNFLYNPNHDTQTSSEYRDRQESTSEKEDAPPGTPLMFHAKEDPPVDHSAGRDHSASDYSKKWSE